MAITGFDLESFASSFDGGARSYLFLYSPNIPNATDLDIRYLVKSTSFPESNIEETISNWQGQDMKFGAKKTYSDWTISFNVDIYASIRQQFENWTNLVHNTEGNINKFFKPSSYYRDQTLQMLDLEGESLLNITLYQAWPKSIGAITLDYSATDVATFDVTFSYNQHIITK